jgi:hypothetical protein
VDFSGFSLSFSPLIPLGTKFADYNLNPKAFA